MANDKGWFGRQASRTAEDIKELPEWLRTQREENERPKAQPADQDSARKPSEKLST